METLYLVSTLQSRCGSSTRNKSSLDWERRSSYNGCMKEQPFRMHTIDTQTVVADFRSSRQGLSVQSDMVRKAANKHFWGNEDGIVGGTVNRIGLCHVSSVHKGIWVASTRAMEPTLAKSVAERFHEDNPLARRVVATKKRT